MSLDESPPPLLSVAPPHVPQTIPLLLKQHANMLPGKRGLGAAAAVKEAPRTLVWKALGFWPLICSMQPGCLREPMLLPTRPSRQQILKISHDQIFIFIAGNF